MVTSGFQKVLQLRQCHLFPSLGPAFDRHQGTFQIETNIVSIERNRMRLTLVELDLVDPPSIEPEVINQITILTEQLSSRCHNRSYKVFFPFVFYKDIDQKFFLHIDIVDIQHDILEAVVESARFETNVEVSGEHSEGEISDDLFGVRRPKGGHEKCQQIASETKNKDGW